jgi:hypothetical protein
MLAAMALMLGLSGVAHGQDSQRERFERGQKVQRDFERQRLVAVGLSPLAEIQAARREVRQAVFMDPYGMLPMPSLQVEHARKGAVTLTFKDRDGSERVVDLPRESWSILAKAEGATFKPPRFKAWDEPAPGMPRPPAPSICHGWITFLGATGRTGARTASGAACGGESPGLAYGAAMARLALATRPDCVVDQDVFWSFQRCFGQKPPTSG